MDSPALIGFALAFVAGPLLAAGLLRLPLEARGIWRLAGLIFLCLGAALLLWAHHALGTLFALWLGWILAVVAMAQALRRRQTSATARRWTTRGALVSCALPWFGLAMAQMMD
ncbi:hypothetical protein KUW09_02115 [Mameliella alba]|nr:hypothetical protein [Antarctobacter heliothermus]MBY6142816.1 hypothetical protein [Mameliella alba]MCA0953459.1 hypothetical protein [Mameliella alba]